MRRRAKHEAMQLNFNDFSGGINVMSAGDLIAMNEMQTCQNFWFLGNQRSLSPRGGISAPLVNIGQEIMSMYYDIDSNTLLVFSKAGNIYRVVSMDSAESIGRLTGNASPVCAKFQDKIWIASGEKLQFYDFSQTDSISTVMDGPVCDIVFQRFARLCVAQTGLDRITYSATGDGTSWESDSNDQSSSQWVDVGYGDSGDIIAVAPLATDLMIIKNNGMIYQLTGDAEVSTWAIYRIATETDAVGRQAAIPIGNDVVFVARNGLKTLKTTMDYGNIATGDIGDKFNLLVRTSQYEPKLFHLRRRKLLLIRPTADWQYFIAYNYAVGAATTLKFAIPIVDIVETLDKVVIASGSSLYELTEESLNDNGTPIDFIMRMKDTVSNDEIIARSLDTDMTAGQAGTVDLRIDNMHVAMPANSRRKVRCNHSTPKLEVEVTSQTPFYPKHITVEVADL